MKKMCRGAVHNTVHSPQQGRKGFIVETDNHTSSWQVSRVGLPPTPLTIKARKSGILRGSNVLGYFLPPCSYSFLHYSDV